MAEPILKPVLTAQEVSAFLDEVFPQISFRQWEITQLSSGYCQIIYTIADTDIRPGGTVSGPTMFTLADVASYVVILGHLGKVALAVTTNLNINFLRRPPQAPIIADTKLLKLGKRLAVCEIAINSQLDGELVAHATSTYSIPPKSR